METLVERRDTAGVTTRLILSFIRRHHGDEGVTRLLELAGETRPAEILEDERSWSTYRQKLALFEAAEQLTGDPLIARRIGEAVLMEQLAAPIRLIIGTLGSPQQVLRSVAKANVKFSTNSQMRCLESRKGRAVVTYEVLDGYTPNRHDCHYTKGILSQVTVLFGLPPAHLEETSCQVDGDEVCTHVVTWSERRWRFGPERQRELIREAELDVLRQQVNDLQDTVGVLVASDDLEDVLGRIASRAGAAVRGQRFLLAVQLDGEGHARIHSDGFGDAEAHERGAQLLDRGRDAAEPDVLVAEVATVRHRHGWLAAYLPPGSGFLPAEQAQLDAYARLAAAALDGATALVAARASGVVSQELLTLAHRLAQAETEADIAHLIAAAVPSVVSASSASVRLWVPETEVLRAAGLHGLPDDLAARAWRLEIPADQVPDLRAMLDDPTPRLYDADDADPYVRRHLTVFGFQVLAVVPIFARDEFLGVVFANWAPGEQLPSKETLFRGMAGLADQAALALSNVRLIERTRHQATHDALTGLANRVLFHEHLASALERTRRTGAPTAVCYLDLDGFKAVNDTYGHQAGDRVLVAVAERLRAAVRSADEVARLAGDEFAVLLREVRDPDDVGAVAAKLVAALQGPLEVDGGSVELAASVGVALAPEHGETPDALLREADLAMYEAKAHGATYRIRATAGSL